MREELLLAMHPSHPLARKRRITAADLDGQPFVLFERGSSTRRVVDDLFAREAISRRSSWKRRTSRS